MNNESSANIRSQWIIFSSLMLIGWFSLTYTGISTAVAIWTVSEVFNHCYIVLPASFYLIWEKRYQINWEKIKPTMLPVPILIGQVLVYLFGLAGDINVLMHIATFTMLPVIIWILIGHSVAYQILFPLCFMIFAIPIGEELVPFLQEITADYSVLLLELTGIPLFRSGLYIEIPQGRFLVAEACSGISFLIASIVLGNLYAYMNLKKMSTRTLFVALSIIFPIFANVVRVYGIIYIGYSSDMKHAVGADHLIYGWFFFAFVLVCLFLIGELIRKREAKSLAKANSDGETSSPTEQKIISITTASFKYSWIIPILILGLGLIKTVNLNASEDKPSNDPFGISSANIISASNNIKTSFTSRAWMPIYAKAATSISGEYSLYGVQFRVFSALYRPHVGELITSQNQMYSEDRWSRAGFSNETMDNGIAFNKLYLSTPDGNYMRVYFTYFIGDRNFTNKNYAKLYQTWLTLMGNDFNSAVLAVGFRGELNRKLNEDEQKILTTLHTTIANEVTLNKLVLEQ